MTVAELKSRLSVFYHIIDTDTVLIAVRDIEGGTTKFFNLQDTYKVQVHGRQLPVLSISTDSCEVPDKVGGKYTVTPMNGSDYWACSNCGTTVGETDNFCKNCGQQLN